MLVRSLGSIASVVLIGCTGAYSAMCSVFGLDVVPPDDAFSLPGVEDDSVVVLHARAEIGDVPGDLVGSSALVLQGSGTWSFSRFPVIEDDTGDTAAFSPPRCRDQPGMIELWLEATDSSANPIDLSSDYPPVQLSVTWDNYLSPREVWPGVFLTFAFSEAKGDN